MNSRKRKIIGLVLLVAAAAAPVFWLFSCGGEDVDDGSPSGVAAAYMRAQLSSDPDVCDYMNSTMQEGWIGSVEASFSPGDTPESCDAATEVFIEWSKKNGQLEVAPDDVEVETFNERIDGDEAKVSVRTKLSDTNRSQTIVVLQREAGKWLVAGTEES